MKLPPEGARWLVSLRWIACATVFFVIWLTSSILHVVPHPLPLYLVAVAMVAYNLAFLWNQSDAAAGEVNAEKNIFLQAILDLAALTLLVYFSDLPRNPFLFFFLFHMIIASMYLRGWAPLVLAAVVTCTVGGIILLEYLHWIPPLRHPFSLRRRPGRRRWTRWPLPGCSWPSAGPCGSRSTSPPRSAATSIGPTPPSGRRKRCWASANSWRASPIRSPIRWTACRTACGGSANA